jgi:hypothetical protein
MTLSKRSRILLFVALGLLVALLVLWGLDRLACREMGPYCKEPYPLAI